MCPVIIEQDDGSFKKRQLDTEVSLSGASGASGEAGSALGHPFWLHTEVSDIGGYRQLLRGEPDQALAGNSTTIEIADGVKIIEEFITEPWEPRTTVLPAGWWHFTLRGYTDDDSEFSAFVVRIYSRTTGGAETLLYESVSPIITGLVAFPAQVIWREYFSESKGINLDDRIVVKVCGITTSVGGLTVGVQFEGTVATGSYVLTQVYTGESGTSGESGQSGLSGESGQSGLSGTYDPAPTLQEVTDEGSITDNDIGCEDLYLNQNGPDGDAFIYFYEGSSPPGEYLKWDDGNDRFEFSNSLGVEGDIELDGDAKVDGNIYINYDAGNADAFIYFGDAGNPTYASIQHHTAHNRFYVTAANGMTVFGALQGQQINCNYDLYMLNGYGEGDSVMYFYENGSPTGAYLKWDDGNGRFMLSHNTMVGGEMQIQGPIMGWGNIELNMNGPEGDSYVYFYENTSPTGAYLMWDDSETEFLLSHHLKVPTLESVGAISAGAVITGGELKSNNDIYVKYAGGDGDSAVYFYENGSSGGAYLMWDDDPGEFVLSHGFKVTELKSNSNVYVNYDGPDGGYIYFHEGDDPEGAHLKWLDGVWFDFSKPLHVTGSFRASGNVLADDNIYVNYGGGEGDSFIYFYEDSGATGAYITWDDSETEFLLSHHLKVPTLESVGAITGASADFAGLLRCNSFRIDQEPILESISPSHSITINVNGTDMKIAAEVVI